MSRSALLSVLAALVLLCALGPNVSLADASAGGNLPASLDNLFPPKAEGPIFWLAMLEMSHALSGLVSDLSEGDMPGAQANLEALRQRYTHLSKLVPEWTPMFPAAPLDEIASAMKSGDQGRIMGAVGKFGQVCQACHVVNMPLAQARYHWDDFSVITATDPITKQDAPYPLFMQMLDGDLSGVGNDLAQGQPEAAAAHAQALAARYGELKATCSACHETPRHYYVDDGVMGMIGRLQTVLAGGAADPKVVQDLVMGIGMESCEKCHLVHIPAAYARQRMGMGAASGVAK